MKFQLTILLAILLSLNGCSFAPKKPKAPTYAGVVLAEERVRTTTKSVEKTQVSVDKARTNLNIIENKTLSALEIAKQIEKLSSE